MPTLVVSNTAPAMAHEDDPNRRVTNESDRVLFQRRCSWVRTCAGCAQYHGVVHAARANVPAVPIHHACACFDIPIQPGEQTKGYPVWQDVVPHLADDQRKRLMGVGNFRLWESGKADLSQILGRRTVRPFRVVAAQVPTPPSALTRRRDPVVSLASWFNRTVGLSPRLAVIAARARLALLRESEQIFSDRDIIDPGA